MLRDFIQNILKVFQPEDAKAESDTQTIKARQRAIAHAKDGYKNAQDIIRLIDSKSTFFTGSAILLIGFTLQLLKQYFELPSELKIELKNTADFHPYIFLAIIVVAILSMLSGVVCLWSSMFSLVGRIPKKDSRHMHTILFPYLTGRADETVICDKILNGISEEDVVKEYACQIWNVGHIVQQKIRRNRHAAWMLLAQIALLTLGGILLLICLP